MAALTVQQATLAGTDQSLQAADVAGDTFPNDGHTMFVIKTAGTGCTATFNSAKPCDQGFDHDLAVVVGATAEKAIGPFNTARWGTTVSVTYTAVTNVTVAARRVV